jgi:hypothetical protein
MVKNRQRNDEKAPPVLGSALGIAQNAIRTHNNNKDSLMPMKKSRLKLPPAFRDSQAIFWVKRNETFCNVSTRLSPK